MNMKTLAAELIGTFALVLVVAGASAMCGGDDAGRVAVALAYWLATTAVLFTWGPVSGGHANPAITFALALAGKMKWPAAAAYWVAQCAGAVLAALLLWWLLGRDTGLGVSTGTFTATAPWKTAAIEAALTFFLVSAFLGTVVAGRGGHAAPLAIGMVPAMGVIFARVYTGASMNPARTLGPAIVMGDLSYVWIYLLGPLAGAALAVAALRLQKREG